MHQTCLELETRKLLMMILKVVTIGWWLWCRTVDPVLLLGNICYAADSNNDNKWSLFNDSSVTPATEANVLEVEAFILLYERQTMPSINE